MASQEIDDIVNNTRLELQEKSKRNKILEDENASLNMKLKEYKDNIKLLKDEIQSLKQSNNNLEAEASKYQSALGIATNFDYSDDQNHSVKLSEDILSLHDTLENYVTTLRPKIDVNLDEVKKLLPKYNCQTKISDKEPNKPLIKAVLQRHVLGEILLQADFYFKRSDQEYLLESDIMEMTTILTGLMEKFYNNRPGNDEITRLIPIRLRQQVYTALGTRGFNDIKESINKYFKHNFIDTVSKKTNLMMNKYRVIKDVEKKKYVEALAEELVINVVRIFYFRLRIQEPIAQYRWFNNNEKINETYMKGSWDEDEIEDLVVEVCSFPLILKPSPDGFKVCTPAKVFPRHIIEKSLFEKGIDTLGVFKKMILPNNDSAPTLQIHENDFERTGSTDTHVSIDA